MKRKNGVIIALIFITLIILIISFVIFGMSIIIKTESTIEEVSVIEENIVEVSQEELSEIEKKPIIIEYNEIDSTNIEKNTIQMNNVQNNITESNNIVSNNSTQNKVNNISGAKYYIKVNYRAQVVNVYEKDSNGNYTVPVKSMVCSTGDSTPTSGVYTIPARWTWLHLFGDVYGHYSTQIVGDILFHSVPYLRKGDNASLEYWEYDKLGTKASLGCVRLTTIDAKWIFDNCSNGTKVEFYSDSNPGPLGKPSAQKISNAEGELKNWDPTDPDTNNPWKKVNNNKAKNNTEQNNITNNTTSNKKNVTVQNNNIVNNTTKNNISNNNIVSNTIKNNTVKK